MKKENKETKETSSLAMHPSLKKQVIAAAKKEGRSFSNYVSRVLEQHIGK